MQTRPRTINLVTRLMIAIVITGLLPLTAITLAAIYGYHVASNKAEDATTRALDTAALVPLQQRTSQTAENIGDFLDERASDIRALALLRPDTEAYIQFVDTRSDTIWYEAGTRDAPEEKVERLPFFRELVSLDSDGRVLDDIVDGKNQTNPDDPERIASYLTEAKALTPDAISVSHLSRLYTPRPADESARPPGSDYATFNGVFRFVAARRTPTGDFDGVVMLALDARHLMDFVVHIHSTSNELSTVWPDVKSGDFATLYDDQGWRIAHPQLWTVRGDDANGQPVPPQTAQMTSAERERHPFNVLQGGWVDPNLPIMFDKAMSGQTGVMLNHPHPADSMATTYIPIPFSEGSYRGVFGVLMIEANTAEFHRSSTAIATAINSERERLQFVMGGVVLLAAILLALAGITISRMIVRPISELTVAARELEEGELDEKRLDALRHRRFSDEVTVLANVFAEMGRKIVRREQQLRTQIADLHIQIDSRRRQQQVEEITETDYFRSLRQTAFRMRSRPQDPDPPDSGTEPEG